MNIEIKIAKLENLKNIQNFLHSLMKYEYKNFDKTSDVQWAMSEECANYLKSRIDEENSLALIACDDDEIVGYLSGGVQKADTWRTMDLCGKLSDMFVEEEYRNKKVGTLLVEEFLKWAKEKGAKRVEVKAFAGNDIACNFYRKHGFEEYTTIFEREV